MARDHRICFRTTRAMYAWTDELARELGWTRSTLVYWLVEYAMCQVAAGDTAYLVDTLGECLSLEAGSPLRRAVDKGLERKRSGGVRW